MTTCRIRVELELESALAPAGVTLVDRYAGWGSAACSCGAKAVACGPATSSAEVPRGRYPVERSAPS